MLRVMLYIILLFHYVDVTLPIRSGFHAEFSAVAQKRVVLGNKK
jgi:hypothetical protein